MRPQLPIFRFIFQRSCDDYQCLILVFSVIYLDSWGYRVGVPRPGIFFFYFFSFLHFFFVSFSGGPFSSRAPGHCPPMPPSRYATAYTSLKTCNETSVMINMINAVHFALNDCAEKPLRDILLCFPIPNNNL